MFGGDNLNIATSVWRSWGETAVVLATALFGPQFLSVDICAI